MRVYGSSPLFNYVELIFRSKRLFIVSIILATLATSGFYLSRKSNYNARMVVLMTGSDGIAADASQKDTVAFKLAVLNIMLKNPQNIKSAMLAADMKGNMSDVAFADFCKRVTASLSYGSDSSNYLEISCTWPNRDCEKILNGFYSFYHEYVIGQTTNVSVTRTKLLTTLLKAYTERHHQLDMDVRNYQLTTMAHKPMQTFEQANQDYLTAKTNVERDQELIRSIGQERDKIAATLRTTPKTIEEARTMNGPAQAPERLSAEQARDAAKKELDDLSLTITAQNPKMKVAQEKYDQALAEVNKIKTQPVSAPTSGDVTSIKQATNPEYQTLQRSLNEHEFALARLQSDLTHAQAGLAAANNRVETAPDEALKLKAMTEDMGLYATMKGQLRSELETARMNELRDRELKAKEMSVVMPPEAEMEKGGARGALLLGAGPILGLVIAFCFSLLAESLDHSLRTPMEVEKYLNKPVLAVLPRMETNRRAAQDQLGSGDHNPPSLPS